MRLVFVFVMLFTSIAFAEHRESFMKKYGCQIYEFFSKTEYRDAAIVVLAQGAFESYWGRAHWVPKRNQVFALKDFSAANVDTKKKPWEYIRCFDDFDAALTAQLEYYRRRGYPAGYQAFLNALDRKKYAKDPDYVDGVRKASKSMWKYVRRHCDCEVQ